MKNLVVAALVAFAVSAGAHEVTDSRKLQQEATAAFKAKNLAVFLEKIHAAAALRPQHPSMQYQLATAYALNGRTDDALDVLERIYEIDMQTRDLHSLPVPADASLLGVDGIYLLNRRTLIAVQNGTNPNRIVRMDLSSDGHSITEVTTLAGNSPLMSDLTLGVLHDGWLFFNANGQWDLFDDSLQPKKDAHFEDLRVLKIRVK